MVMTSQIARHCTKFKSKLEGLCNFLSNVRHGDSMHKSCCTYSTGISGNSKSSGILFNCSKSSHCLGHRKFVHNYGKRFYYVDRNSVQHFNPRGPRKWLENPKILFSVVLVTTGATVALYYGNLETVPYTKRSHFVLLSIGFEKQLGEMQFEQVKSSFKGKILPSGHPDSVRARDIATNIIMALQRGLSADKVYGEQGNALMVHDETFSRNGVNGDMSRYNWGKEEIMDDKWVKDSQSHGKMYQPSTMHLEGWKWEILVVSQPLVNAFCLPGGKIVIFTGLLKHFRTDSEIATIISHEVGHVVARHAAEQLTKNIWFTIMQLVLSQFIMPDVVNTMSTFLLRLPFSRRMEIEADCIGLLLMASAGYDPRVGPSVYQKLGKLTGTSTIHDYLSTHPSGETRAKLLARAKVMDEAMAIYRDLRGGSLAEGFLRATTDPHPLP